MSLNILSRAQRRFRLRRLRAAGCQQFQYIRISQALPGEDGTRGREFYDLFTAIAADRRDDALGELVPKNNIRWTAAVRRKDLY